MYGTVARLQLKPGAAPLFNAWFDGIVHAIRPNGMVSTTIFRSDEDENVCWLSVVFESKEAYHANADSSGQNDRYVRLRSLLETDPEWHDGEVWATTGLD
jgi:quinol monooxygenase YgiN